MGLRGGRTGIPLGLAGKQRGPGGFGDKQGPDWAYGGDNRERDGEATTGTGMGQPGPGWGWEQEGPG